MAKVELRFEVDEELMARLQAAGVDPAAAAESGLREALRDIPRPLGLVESARRKALDPQGAERRARAWAEASREALEEQKAWLEEHGPFGEAWRTW